LKTDRSLRKAKVRKAKKRAMGGSRLGKATKRSKSDGDLVEKKGEPVGKSTWTKKTQESGEGGVRPWNLRQAKRKRKSQWAPAWRPSGKTTKSGQVNPYFWESKRMGVKAESGKQESVGRTIPSKIARWWRRKRHVNGGEKTERKGATQGTSRGLSCGNRHRTGDPGEDTMQKEGRTKELGSEGGQNLILAAGKRGHR